MAYCTIADVEAIQAGRLNGGHYSDYSQSALTLTITDGTPGVINYPANGFSNGQAVQVFAVGAGVLPSTIISGTTYYAGNVLTNTFNLYTKPEQAIRGGTLGVINTTGSSGNVYVITPATIPSLTQINGFMDDSYNEINQVIRKMGFVAPVTVTAELSHLNSIGTAMHIELTKLATGINKDAVTLYDILKTQYNEGLKDLEKNPRIAGIISSTQNNGIATSDGVTYYTSSTTLPFTIGNPNQW